MYLQGLVKRARVPLRRQGDGWTERPFPADFGSTHHSGPPASTRTFIFYFRDTSPEWIGKNNGKKKLPESIWIIGACTDEWKSGGLA